LLSSSLVAHSILGGEASNMSFDFRQTEDTCV
jgi:hypothetical protein